MSQIKLTVNNHRSTVDQIQELSAYSQDQRNILMRLSRLMGNLVEGSEGQSMSLQIDGGQGAAQASGTLSLSGVVAGNTAQVGDQVFVASASPVGPNQFLVGISDTATAVNLAAAINANPSLANVVTASSSGTVVTITSASYGNTGNNIQLVGSSNMSALGLAASYAALGASAVTGSASASTLTGNIGIYPNNSSSITNFPPSTFSGVENAGNTAAANAQAAAQAAYTLMKGMSSTTIATALDGQTLTPGVYSASSGTFTLAASGTGTLTLNGNGTYIFQTNTTLITGAGGVPVINLSGGALESNVYWVVGSSATINSGHAGTFQGSVIAQSSITNTSGGTVNGSLIALTGAVTYSAAATSIANGNVSSVDITPSGPYMAGGIEPVANTMVLWGTK